ncbi:MAG TPA: hypothetical protein VF337_02970 [Candidatus Limnocylindrales bacterium]
MKRPALALSAGILMMALLPGSTLATFIGTVDQENTVISNGGTNSSQPLAQTFTAGKTGLLTQIQLSMRATGGDIGLQIEATTGGLPNGTVLATTVHTSPSNISGWCAFSLASPIPVIAGTKYAIVFDMSPLTGVPTADSSGNTYPGGQALLKSGSTWGAVNGLVLDWDFKTLVDPQTTTLHWDKTYIYAGTTTPLTLTETVVFPGLFDPLIESVALPSWFTVTGVACSSQIAGGDCIVANVAPGSSMAATSNGDPVVVTLTGTASPALGAAGTAGAGRAEGCMQYTESQNICVTGQANVSVLAIGATPPPTTTDSSLPTNAPNSSILWLSIGLIGFLGTALLLFGRRQRLTR